MGFRSTISTVAALASIGATAVAFHKASEGPKPQAADQPTQVRAPASHQQQSWRQ